MLSSPPTEETNLVPLSLLKRYLDIGFILVHLFQNSVHPNIDGLVTDAEWESLRDSVQIEGRYKGDLSGKRPRKNLLALYHLSDRFWTYERLEKEHHRFFGVSTLLGKSPRKALVNGNVQQDLYILGCYPDCDSIRDLLFNEILCKQNLAAKTFITKTHKAWHTYWLSHKQHPPLSNSHCKPDSKVELKTNLSSMTLTLPPTHHRTHREFRYKQVSSTDQLIIDDTLYGIFISVLQSNGHLRKIPTLKSEEGRNGEARKNLGTEKIIPNEGSRHQRSFLSND